MKLKSKLKLYEEFLNESIEGAAVNNTSSSNKTAVAIDKVSVDKTEAVRTEIVKDVDTILNNLIELSDRIGESVELDSQIDDLYEELYYVLNVASLNEGIIDFIKSPIKYVKIQKALKAYQKALVQKSINDIDFAKKKQAADEEGDDKAKEVLKQANLAKNQALKDQENAINDRMTELAKGDEGLGKVVALGKAKSKMAAAKTVMKAASGEEAKQLKLEISDLEDRIADDEQSLKDYAKKEAAKDQTEGTPEPTPTEKSAEEQSDDQLDGGEKPKPTPSAEAKPEPTPSAEAKPEPTPTPEEAKPEPTEEAKPEPTEEAKPEPTEEAKPEPTEEATPEPTPEPTPTPKPVEDSINLDSIRSRFSSLMENMNK